MKLSERIKLLHGPYRSPRVRRGDVMFCEIRGSVRVTSFTNGPIPWPRALILGHGRRGKPAMVICGDLLQAIRTESNLAVQYWWGVKECCVTRWRKTLGVAEFNEGSKRLCVAKMEDIKPPDWRERIAARSHKLESHIKALATLRANGRHRGNLRQWKPDEITLLGTMPDPALAMMLGCSVYLIAKKRQELGIASYRGWKERRGVYRAISRTKLIARRYELGLTRAEVARRMGCSGTRIMYFENISQRVRPETLTRLAHALECPPSRLEEVKNSSVDR